MLSHIGGGEEPDIVIDAPSVLDFYGAASRANIANIFITNEEVAVSYLAVSPNYGDCNLGEHNGERGGPVVFKKYIVRYQRVRLEFNTGATGRSQEAGGVLICSPLRF